MKKALVGFVFLALLGFGSTAQAAFIQCTPNQAEVINQATSVPGGAIFTCSPGAGSGAGTSDDNVLGDGATISTVRLSLSGTFQENFGVTGSLFSVLYTATEGSLSFVQAPFACTANATAGAPPATTANQALGACSATTAFVAVPGSLDVIPTFTVTVTGAAGSNPLPFNASASIFYEVTTGSTAVPEPATFGLLGIGLAGAYIARRRQAKAV